jgi:hypothetical protein
MNLEKQLEELYESVESLRQRASDLDKYADLAEYSKLATIAYDLSCYFGGHDINKFQKQRLINLGFNA